MLALTLLALATTQPPAPGFVRSGETTLSMDEVRALRREAEVPSVVTSIIPNGDFETGMLLPWDTNNWTITSTDAQAGTYSAWDIDNFWIRYCFNPIPVANVSAITFWTKQPEAAIQAVDFFYSPTDFDEFLVFPGMNWTFENVTSHLRPTGSLETLRVWGYVGAGPAPDLTLSDTFSIDTTVPFVPCTPLLAVEFDSFDAVAGPAGIEVTWRTLAERDTVDFAIERAAAREGPWERIGLVDASGAGFAYRLLDAGAGSAVPYYRIVEYTSSGRGDETAPFPARRVTAGGSGGRDRHAGR